MLTPARASHNTSPMTRLAITSVLGLAAGLLAGCDKGEGNQTVAPGHEIDKLDSVDKLDSENGVVVISITDALAYIPDGANVVFGLDAATVATSEPINDILERWNTPIHDHTNEVLAAADACNVPMSTWDYAFVAGEADLDGDVILVVSAIGVGKKDTLDCIGRILVEESPQARFDVGEEDGRVVVSAGDENQKVYALSDDVVALVSANWQGAFKDRLEGEGKAALDGSLKDVMASIDRSQHMYFGAVANAAMRREFTEPLKHVTITVDLSEGLSIAALAEFADIDTATALAEQYTVMFEQLKGFLAKSLDLPWSVLDSVKIEAKGASVVFSVSATGDDVEPASKSIATLLNSL